MKEPYRFREFYIRENMLDAIDRYVEHGIPPGDFLSAVIRNDFCEAVMRADDENMRNLPAFVAYFYNEAPRACWGSEQNMDEWITRKQREREKVTT